MQADVQQVRGGARCAVVQVDVRVLGNELWAVAVEEQQLGQGRELSVVLHSRGQVRHSAQGCHIHDHSPDVGEHHLWQGPLACAVPVGGLRRGHVGHVRVPGAHDHAGVRGVTVDGVAGGGYGAQDGAVQGPKDEAGQAGDGLAELGDGQRQQHFVDVAVMAGHSQAGALWEQQLGRQGPGAEQHVRQLMQ